VLIRQGLADHDGVGGSIRNHGQIDLAAKSIEEATDLARLMRITMVRTPIIAVQNPVLWILDAHAGGRISPAVLRFPGGITIDVIGTVDKVPLTAATPADGALRADAADIVAGRRRRVPVIAGAA